MDQLAAMRGFVKVAEVGSFSKAALVLDVPKPSLTKQIQTLEAHLATKLLNRTTRRVTVTPDGAAYYERALRLLSDLDELDGAMAQSQATPKGRLRVDVSPSLASSIIVPAVPAFHARYPDIQIDLSVTDRPVDLLAENVDCVVRAGTLTDLSLVARRVGDMQLRTAAAPAYLARHGMPATPADLERESHRVVGYLNARTGRTHPFSFYDSSGAEIDILGHHALAVNDGNVYMTAALIGLGVIQVPTFMLNTHLQSGALVPVLGDWAVPSMPLHVVYPPNRHLSNRLRVFVDWISGLFVGPDFGAPSR
ncbi:LysR substrate-binding domain-containing protein [Azorhizobium sp. AG788]|uniref:LysR substrate-binding domain-containing protein n=1 Tax=Azorhizobium sp. AG788 TaxID=2183897 RepID=UPI003138EEE4